LTVQRHMTFCAQGLVTQTNVRNERFLTCLNKRETSLPHDGTKIDTWHRDQENLCATTDE